MSRKDNALFQSMGDTVKGHMCGIFDEKLIFFENIIYCKN